MTIYQERVGVESPRLDALDQLAEGRDWVFITEDTEGNKFYFEAGGPWIGSPDDSENFILRAVTRLLQLKPAGD